jgi:hypothetical protein
MLAYNFAYYIQVDLNKKTATTALCEAEYHKMGHDISLGFQGKLLAIIVFDLQTNQGTSP